MKKYNLNVTASGRGRIITSLGFDDITTAKNDAERYCTKRRDAPWTVPSFEILDERGFPVEYGELIKSEIAWVQA